MTETPRRGLTFWGGAILALATTLLVLAAIPFVQFWVLHKFLGDEAFRAYLQSNLQFSTFSTQAFYQFVLSAIVLLIAVAGYLTYRSRKDAIDEAKDNLKRDKEELQENLRRQAEALEERHQKLMDEFKEDHGRQEEAMAGMREEQQKLKDEAEKNLRGFQTYFADLLKVAQGAVAEIDSKKKRVSDALEQQGAEGRARIATTIAAIQLPKLGETEAARLIRETFNAGVQAQASGEVDEAIKCWTKVLDLDPNLAAAYSNRGDSYNSKGQFELAIADCTRAIKINPNYGDAYNNRGIAHTNMRRLDLALADFTRAIELDPKRAAAYNNRGAAYIHKGDFDSATTDYTRAIGLDPSYVVAYHNRGLAYLEKNKRVPDIRFVDSAISNFAEAYLRAPGEAGYRYHSARAYALKWTQFKNPEQNEKNLDACVDDLRRAIQLSPVCLDWARTDNDFNGVRNEPKVRAILGNPPYSQSVPGSAAGVDA